MFNKKYKKLINTAYAILAVLMVVSMILLYIPSLYR